MTILLLNKIAGYYLYMVLLLLATSRRVALANKPADSQTDIGVGQSFHLTASGHAALARQTDGYEGRIKSIKLPETITCRAVYRTGVYKSATDVINVKVVIQRVLNDLTIQLIVYSRWNHLAHRMDYNTTRLG